MSTLQLMLTLLTVLSLAVGQILFKLAAKHMESASNVVDSLFLNGWLWISLLVYGLATLMWVFLLRQLPLYVAYPFVALAFIFVPVLSHYFLAEPLRWQTILGGGVILVGVWISVGFKA